MAYSNKKIFIHAFWSTLAAQPIISPDLKSEMLPFIQCQFNESGCPPVHIAIQTDHIHCLFLLHPHKTIAEVIKQEDPARTISTGRTSAFQSLAGSRVIPDTPYLIRKQKN